MSGTTLSMPKLADTLVEGTVARWLKQVGDPVAEGEPLVEIETDKVSTELVAPAGGVLTELLAEAGSTVPVGAPLARIGDSATAHAGSGPAGPHPQPPPPNLGEGVGGGGENVPPPEPSPKTTSVAARMLAEHGLRADEIAGEPGRRVTKRDVLRFVESRTASPPPPELGEGAGGGGSPFPSTFQPLTSMRRAIADHMARARATIPHGQTVMAADVTRPAAWREREKAAFQDREGAPLTFTVFFVGALGRALARIGPELGIPLPRRDGRAVVDLGIAVAIPAGLIVPVVRDADSLDLGALARAVRDLADRARAGTLSPDQTTGAVMSVTNVGSFGNLSAFPIVPLSQVGILGPGLVERRPLPGPDGGIKSGWRCLIGLVFDRRVLSDLAADRLLRGVLDELDRLAHEQVGAAASGSA